MTRPINALPVSSVLDSIRLGEGFRVLRRGSYPIVEFAISGAVRNVDTLAWEWQNGPWRIAVGTDSDIVRAVFAAYLAFVEHEARETFTYCGKRIFGPHIAVDALLEVADRVDYERPAG